MREDFVIRAEGISKSVTGPAGRLTILDNINFHARKGESIAILGVSGSGKSTLLGLLAGLDLPTAGSIFIDQRDITLMNEDARAQWRARRVGFVFQAFHLVPSLNALENVMLPLEMVGLADARPLATRTLQRVGLGERMEHYPRQLSGGEQQRVALARAFAPSPTILFADEPTGNLDAGTAASVEDLMFTLNKERGTTLVLVTHDTTLAARCDRVVRMKGGHIIEQDAPADTAAATSAPV
ncbi:MAG: ATP-binding cassette domain-containing protein [Gammaproteobacteria bacterium]|nr:ATP-binding cassette domain-containing protein [Gammaproteobacteria bacterium]